MRDRIVVALGNFIYSDLPVKKYLLKAADVAGYALLIGFLGYCVLG